MFQPSTCRDGGPINIVQVQRNSCCIDAGFDSSPESERRNDLVYVVYWSMAQQLKKEKAVPKLKFYGAQMPIISENGGSV